MIRVSTNATYSAVLALAQEKFKAYHCNHYEDGATYHLLYESGKKADFHPGTTESFNLRRYKEELGKDYKSIVLFLCTHDDFLGELLEDLEEEEEPHCPPKKRKAEYQIIEDDQISNQNKGDDQISEQIKEDETLARKLQSVEDAMDQSGVKVNKQSCPETVKDFDNISELINHLNAKTSSTEQFFMVVRRGSDVQRYLKIWQREAEKHSPECVLKVHFTGENGVDSGAMAKEFLTDAIEQMRSKLFPNGTPKDSMFYAHKGYFFSCGQICLVSIVQGGPPPLIFQDCVYDMMVNGEVDLTTLSPHEHLIPHEKNLIERITKDPQATDLQDIIIEHGYTGPINVDHIDDIIGTVTLSIVTNRMLYLQEFKRGLNHYGFLDVLQKNPKLCKELFVIGTSTTAVDSNYVVSQLQPQFSDGGTAARTIEEKVFDHLHDFIMDLEDNTVEGYSEEIAYSHNDTEDEAGGIQFEGTQTEVDADLSPAGILGWLTGQKHRPVDSDKLQITVYFDHDCKKRLPNHTICYPTVSACGRTLRLPVVHMRSEEEFKKVMVMALCKGQAFGCR